MIASMIYFYRRHKGNLKIIALDCELFVVVCHITSLMVLCRVTKSKMVFNEFENLYNTVQSIWGFVNSAVLL